MPDASWKAFERRVARWFGGVRRGADTRGRRGGKNDIICEVWSPECALLSQPNFSALMHKVRQAERNSIPGRIPVAIVKRKNHLDADALVIFRGETFRHWFLDGAADSVQATEDEAEEAQREGVEV